MKNYISHHPWKIIEEGFHAEYNQISESLFSIGNARFGQRANFEEHFSGETLQGNYVAGVYYPDKTKVGWWKNGYPEYFAKVLNNCNWILLDISINGNRIDLAKCEVQEFYRELDMQRGVLHRNCTIKTADDIVLKITSDRFCSFANKDLGTLSYTIEILEGKGTLICDSFLDFDIRNQDSNYQENFWTNHSSEVNTEMAYVCAETKKTAFKVAAAAHSSLSHNGNKIHSIPNQASEAKVGHHFEASINSGDVLHINKYAAIVSSMYYDEENFKEVCKTILSTANQKGFDKLKEEHAQAWEEKWNLSDIKIEGDVAAQQGIRFNIFHLNQTYDGTDDRLNIGPKGFTGEKYGGSTYWDTEAYCLPFYLFTAEQTVARNLLVYRYKQLGKAIENATKLGFSKGAALYPMVTMNGEECHNEWEITFEEIHRNGAIAYAIFDYIRFTGDQDYMQEYGLEVLIGISRFWAQRVNFSKDKNAYVMLGVTGPNEYENNVNNNWYTNYIARWCLDYTRKQINALSSTLKKEWTRISTKLNFEEEELEKWHEIVESMYLPEDKEKGLFLQQDGFYDKDIVPVAELSEADQPLNQKWSWDRILRSCYIKQADVLQGLYFFEDHFSEEIIAKNFDYYEPLTVHESSLSPCVHAILAAKLGKHDKAYEMYLRTSRLDLDDYNNDSEDGLHITSMAGTYISVVEGFAGIRILDDTLHINPALPKLWESIHFSVLFRQQRLDIHIQKDQTTIKNNSDRSLVIFFNGKETTLAPQKNSILQSVDTLAL